MELVLWSDKLSVGVKTIDRQHQTLIDMINRIITDTDLTVRSEKMTEILTEMTRYAVEYFQSEEGLLAEFEYPHLEEHKAQHREFRKKTMALCNATAAGVEAVPQILINFLREWLRSHVLEEDMKYKDFFMECGVR